MNLAVVILIGVGIGTMVELLLPGHHFTELLLAVLLGAAGALAAHFVGQTLGLFGPTDGAAFVSAGIGAIIVLLAWGLLFRRNHRRQ